MAATAELAGLWLMLFSSLAQAGWVQFAQSGNAGELRIAYYDPLAVARLPDGRISLWEKEVRSPESAIAERKEYGLPTARFENFAYTLQRIIIDCSQRQYAVASIRDYSSYEEILDIIDRPSSEWRFNDIISGSVTGIIMKRVCELK